MSDYSHLLEIDEEIRCLTIYRVCDAGRKELFTQTPLPGRPDDADEARFADFCRMLGENILLDSPAARRLLGL